MDDTLKNTLLQFRLDSALDEHFIRQINNLAENRGPAVYRACFELLAGVNLPEEDAERHWLQFHEHRVKLIEKLARDVDIATAMCDYLRMNSEYLSHPRIIETLRYETVFHNTVHDRLTGLFNRHYYDESFAQQIAQARRYNDNLSLLFLDIDNFKEINDNYGHGAGDEVLKKLSALLTGHKRDSDIAARYGGEEFLLLMTRTDLESAIIVGERLRKKIEQEPVSYRGNKIYFTVSGGIASCPLHATTADELLRMADNALYQAKGAGKNKIFSFRDEKRRYMRVEFIQPVLTKELDFQESQTYACKSKDICVGGMLFETQQPFPVGALLTVRVSLDEGPPVLLIGNVVRVAERGNHKYDIGLTNSIQTMDKIAHRKIADLLHSSGVM